MASDPRVTTIRTGLTCPVAGFDINPALDALDSLAAENEKLRNAVEDALVVFDDTQWASAYRHLAASPEERAT